MNYTMEEQMIVIASRLLKDGDVVYTGVGLPTKAVFLAKLTYAPNVSIVFETGIIRSEPCQLPIGVDTLPAQTRSDMLSDAFYVNTLAEQGRVTYGFVGAGQVDRFGNINSTCVGPYNNPELRFPGGGGACDILSLCNKTVIIMNQKKQRFPERVDFITGPGYLDGHPGTREKVGLRTGTGPYKVITNMAVYSFVDNEFILESVHTHSDVTIEMVRENVMWPLKEVDKVIDTPTPTKEKIEVLRTRIDQGVARI